MSDFEKLYQKHYRALFTIAKKMLSDDEAPSDIVQDVFISFFEIGKKGKEILNPKSYLVRATLNKCIDYTVRGRRFEKINDRQVVDVNIDRKDDKEVIRTALSAMNEHDRKLLVLYSEGYSYKEIAEMSDIKFTSVGKTLSRALKKMKEEIKKLDHGLS